MQIRENIDFAKKEEEHHKSLYDYLDVKIQTLHRAIELPEHNKTRTLARFLVRYIDYAAMTIEAVKNMCHDLGLESFAQPFIESAEAYFFSPPECIAKHQEGLIALASEVYLTHRLFEEFDDKIVRASGNSIIPGDMMIPNLIVHQVIGDTLGNQLDAIVSERIDRLFKQQRLHKSQEFQQFLLRMSSGSWPPTKYELDWPFCDLDDELELKLPIFDTLSYSTLH